MEFTLGTGQLRGTYDLGAVPREDRQFWKVYLVPVREAHVDVFFSPCDGYSRSEEMAQVEIGGDGAFQFAWLATGRYVFWVTGRDDEIVVARCFDVPDGARVDLGTVRRGLVVDATVRCGLGNQHGMWVRMEDPGNDEGVFVRTVAVHEGRIELKGIAPGRYRLQPFRIVHVMTNSGFSGDLEGKFEVVEIGTDGRVQPERVFR